MDKAIELPIEHCELKVRVGWDGVWLEFGSYAAIHVYNTLVDGKPGIISHNIEKWIVEREAQATSIQDAN